MPSRLNPLRGLVHGSIEGLGPVPFVQPLCKHLHRPLSHRDLPSAFICALVHRRERTRGCRWCIPKSVSVAEDCGNCQLLLQSRTFLRRCRGKPGLEPRRSARRVMSSGTVEAADACSESSTELSSIGPSEMSDCNRPRLAPQQSS
jgi:hypothetical protein